MPSPITDIQLEKLQKASRRRYKAPEPPPKLNRKPKFKLSTKKGGKVRVVKFAKIKAKNEPQINFEKVKKWALMR